jgi:mono/diheme cytochrome c family protein
MRCGKLFVSTLFLAVLTACGDPEPVSTGTKAPGLNRASGNQQPATTNTTPGDATKGQTLVTSNCTACHGAQKIGHALTKADVGRVAKSTGVSSHKGLETVLTGSAADIEAYLATQ